MSENYSVCQFFEDGNYEFVRRFISPEEAVNVAIHYSTSIAAKNHMVTRVIITDSGDQCNWEWKFDEGITFPPQFVGKLKRGIR
jgi:hypothetical protein